MIDAIVLAAGMSKRMKDSNKLLLQYNQKTIIEQVLNYILDAEINKVIVVLGHDHNDVLKAIGSFEVEFIFNAAYQKGQSTSIQAAMSMLTPESDGFMVCLGDMPLLQTDDYNKLIDHFYDKTKMNSRPIVRPMFKGSIGNPVIFHSSYARDILLMRSGSGCKQLITENKRNFFPLEVSMLKYFFDVDNSDDYRRLLLSTSENEQ